MKIIIIAFLLLYACVDCTNSIYLNCDFKESTWLSGCENIYQCVFENKGNIITEKLDRTVIAVPPHQGSKTNDDVKGFYVSNSNFLYFPIELEKFFKNLMFIGFLKAKLKEIRKEDLKPFTDLKCFGSNENNLEVLEANLFEFNTKLTNIYLARNQIVHIDPSIFTHFINKLSYLYLGSNPCSLVNANGTPETNELISKIQSGVCRNDAKLKDFLEEASTTTTTTTTEAITTTTTTSIPPINVVQFDELKKMIEKLSDDNEKLNEELKNVEEKLTKKIVDEFKDTKTTLKTLTDQCKASCKNATASNNAEFEARVKFLEKAVGVDSEFHNNNQLP